MRDLITTELANVYGGTGKSKCAPPPKHPKPPKGCKPSKGHGSSSGGGHKRRGKGSSS